MSWKLLLLWQLCECDGVSLCWNGVDEPVRENTFGFHRLQSSIFLLWEMSALRNPIFVEELVFEAWNQFR